MNKNIQINIIGGGLRRPVPYDDDIRIITTRDRRYAMPYDEQREPSQPCDTASADTIAVVDPLHGQRLHTITCRVTNPPLELMTTGDAF